SGARCYVVRGDSIESVLIDRVRPGSLLVLSSDFGGADEFGFAPASVERVADISFEARVAAGRSAALVWTRAIAERWLSLADDDARQSARALEQQLAEDDEDPDIIVFGWL